MDELNEYDKGTNALAKVILDLTQKYMHQAAKLEQQREGRDTDNEDDGEFVSDDIIESAINAHTIALANLISLVAIDTSSVDNIVNVHLMNLRESATTIHQIRSGNGGTSQQTH